MERGRRRTHKQDGSLAGVQDSQLLVLAGREDSGSVSVPADAVDHVAVDAVDPHHGLAAGHVPQDDHVIAGWGEEGGVIVPAPALDSRVDNSS